jgi:GT2 family glycosyltransferase
LPAVALIVSVRLDRVRPMFRSLGVQVVTYNNDPSELQRLAEGLSATLSSARRAGVEQIEVYVGDCAAPSTISDVAEALEAELEAVVDGFSAIDLGANLGSGGGSNALAARHDHEVIWVLNPDTYPSPQCAVELLTALGGDGVAAAEGRQIPLVHPRVYDRQTGDTSWGSGCCLMLRREAFDAVGGFDGHFFPMYCDDVDLSWRLQLAGWRVVHVPAAAVFHDKRITTDGTVAGSDFEARSGALARLWLARRYGRPDIETEWLSFVDEHGSAPQRAAVAEFRQRLGDGDVPEPIEGGDRIAQFVQGEYAVHRFGQQA